MQCEGLGEQLTQAQAESKDGGSDTNTPIVKHNHKRGWNEKQEPDQNVSHDTAKKLVHVEQNSTVPEDGHEQPGEWECSSGHVDQEPVAEWTQGESLVGKVQGKDVQEVQDQDHLGPEIVLLNEKQSPCPMEQVKGGEMPADVLGDFQSVGDSAGIVDGRNKDLGDKEDLHQQKHSPIHHGDYNVEREWSVHTVVWIVMAKWVSTNEISERIVGCNQPRQDGEDLVSEDVVNGHYNGKKC